MPEQNELRDLEELLERLRHSARDRERVSVDDVLEEVGRRSFGPIILLAGLITLAPVIGDIPGVPTIIAVLVLLVAGQLLFRGNRFWLPKWLRHRSVDCQKLLKIVNWSREPARFIDRLLKPRLPAFAGKRASHAIALACLIIAAAMPMMEVVPFSANGAGAALTAFGLSLIAHDGLLALVAFICAAGTFAAVGYALLG